MKNIPLLISYILFPLVMIIERLVFQSTYRNWIEPLWLLSFAVPFLIILAKGGKTKILGVSPFPLAIAGLGFLLLLTVRLAAPLFGIEIATVPMMMEIKPFVYLFLVVAWLAAFGPIDRESFLRAGAWLGGIIFFDFIVESLIAGRISRPRGSGEINYDACLLLITFCLSLGHKVQRKSLIIWIFLGLLATFSRTALFAAGVIFILLGKFSVKIKLSFASILFLFVALSFMLRGLAMDSLESMDRYWMWITGLGLLTTFSPEALFGFPLGSALPVVIPKAMEWLWNSQQEGWGIDGIYPFHFHAFWLRLAISWGWVMATLVLMYLVRVFLDRRVSSAARALALLVLFEGLTMGVFYISNVSIPLTLALVLAIGQLKTDPEYPKSPVVPLVKG